MRRSIAIVTGLLLLYGCGGAQAPGVDSPGLSGIGAIKIGQTFEEVSQILPVRLPSFMPNSNLFYGEEVSYFRDLSREQKQAENFPELKEISGYYSLIDGEEEIDLTLDFYRDTLVYIDNRGGGLVKEALTEKYGESKSNLWVGETATAHYYQREEIDGVEVYPTGRDIKREMEEYILEALEAKEKERKEALREAL